MMYKVYDFVFFGGITGLRKERHDCALNMDRCTHTENCTRKCRQGSSWMAMMRGAMKIGSMLWRRTLTSSCPTTSDQAVCGAWTSSIDM